MLFGKYRFHCVIINDVELPAYKGSTFRGAFGFALKRVVCVIKTEQCGNCVLKHKCIYYYIFENPENQAAEKIQKGNSSCPHPYVIEPPLTEETNFSKGASFDFNLLLFGKANEYLPYFIYAFKEMGAVGIGRRVGGARGKFILRSVYYNDKEIYSGENQSLIQGDYPENLILERTNPQKPPISKIKFIIETPLRFKFENKLSADLPFHVLVRTMLRRIFSLLHEYGDGEPELDYKGLVDRAGMVRAISSSIKWYDWKRYSSKQDIKMLMGGIVGFVIYQGFVDEFLPLFEFCEIVHIGKQTSFGLGKFRKEVHRMQ